MAGTERVELPLTEPESAVLPLDEVPICHFVRLSAQGSTIRESSRARNQKFWRSYAPASRSRGQYRAPALLLGFGQQSLCWGRTCTLTIDWREERPAETPFFSATPPARCDQDAPEHKTCCPKPDITRWNRPRREREAAPCHTSRLNET